MNRPTFGYLPPVEPHRGVEFLARTAPPDATTTIDLRAFAPPARFQGPVGACTGFSSRGAIRGLMAAAIADRLWGGEPFDPSPAAIYAGARARTGMLTTDSGAPISAVVEVLASGIPDERDWPFDPARWAEAPPERVWTRAARAARLVNATPLRHQLDDLRAAMADGCPLLVGIPCFDGDRGIVSPAAFATGRVGHPLERDDLVGWHAVSVWGHDPARDVLFFQNSWEGWSRATNCVGEIPTGYVLHLANEIYALGAIR